VGTGEIMSLVGGSGTGKTVLLRRTGLETWQGDIWCL
jgi:ABC-type transporter Mla maintaining outer membrane lipid asymmetry ATPase subunit MlaF